jgi:hypothetical protein
MARSHSGSRWLRRLLAPALIAGLMLVVPAAAQAQSCSKAISGVSGAGADFDGDGKLDVAIGDPNATVSGNAQAGRVHIAYGDGPTPMRTQTILPTSFASNDAGAGERFGYTMDSTDWNGDGCSDLFIGAPYEMWSGGVAETGVVVFIPGSPAGLNTAAAQIWSQSSLAGAGSVDTNEPGDRFGWDLAAGLDTAGKPFLVVGAPGEDGAVDTDGGYVFYARPGKATVFSQNTASFSDSFESGDMFGYSVAASESGFVVGVPGEDAEYSDHTIRDVGTVFLVAHNDATAAPSQITAWGQDSANVSDKYENGDMYGYALDMVDYISTGGGAAKMMIAVGAPAETIGTRTAAGLSMVMWSPGTGISEYKYIYQDVDGNAADGSERGDLFGAAVAMVNRTPGQNTSTDTLLMAVGSPGEDVDGKYEVGEVGLFSMVEDVSAGGDTASAALSKAGVNRVQGSMIGATMHATIGYLWVTSSDPAAPAVYGIPWDNIVASGTGAVLVRTPGNVGATDVVAFGAALA